MDSRTPHSLRHLALCLLVSLPTLEAQEPEAWSTHALPGTLTAPVAAVGTQLTLRAGTNLLLYSGIRRAWTSLTIAPGAAVFPDYNDHVIVRDGGTIQCWSPRTGQIAAITVSPTASLLVGTAGRTWVAAVQDGTTVYGYAAFTNTWAPITVASPTATITLNKVTLVVDDGSSVRTMSSYHGTWTSSPAATVRSVQENVALTVDGADVVRAYSAYTNAWSTTTFPGAGTATVTGAGNTYSLLIAGTRVLGYSAARDTFATYVGSTAPAQVTPSLEAVAFRDGTTLVGFGSGTGTFATRTLATPAPQLFPGENRFGCFVIAVDGTTLVGYSGVRGAFSAPITGTYTLTLSDACALAESPSATHAYSALTNAWSPAPNAAITNRYLLYNGVVLAHAGSLSGYSARLGTWSTLARTPATAEMHGSLFLDRSGASADAYDPRLGRWTTVSGGATLQPFSVWRLMTVTHDGTDAIGYSLFAGRPFRTPLQGAVTEYRANSEIGYVLTSTHVHAFAGTGSLSARYRFPEHSREARLGAPLWLQQLAPAGSQVTLVFAQKPAFVPFGTLGTLFLDTATFLGSVPVGAVPASGVLDLAIPVRQDPGLVGAPLEIQGLVVPIASQPYLTNSLSPVFF